MKKMDFNQDWLFWKEGAEEKKQIVVLPHDAMIHEKRDPKCLNAKTTGFFPGGTYHYEKRFTVPENWSGREVLAEFEGVYQNVSVFLNGEKLYWQPYGYTGFSVALGEKLRAGEENVLSVLADNSGEPNTRWYSGSGIYRPVWLYVGSPMHIEVDGIQVTTKSCDPAVIHVATRVSPEDRKGEMEVALTIRKDGELIAEARGMDADIRIPNAALWSAETPELYTCEAVLYQDGTEMDRQETAFGAAGGLHPS